MLRLFLDTSNDITKQEASKYGADVISMPVNLHGRLIYPGIDSDDYLTEFYKAQRDGEFPKTSALNISEYLNIFEPVFANGDDVLFVHFSREMSSTINNLDIAINELKTRYPDRSFYTVDTKCLCINGRLISLSIAEFYKKNKNIAEILKFAEQEVKSFATYFFVEDLKFLSKSGRINAAKAFFGTIIGIKPIIKMSLDGHLDPCDKVKGTKNALKYLIDKMDELKTDDFKKYDVLITYGDNLELAERFALMVKERFGEDIKLSLIRANVIITSHSGPDVLALAFRSKER